MLKWIKKLRNRKAIFYTEFTIKPSNIRPGREHICFPDGLRIIVEDGEYIGFYTQKPSV